jgi:Xaa-Pro aminopeptidase
MNKVYNRYQDRLKANASIINTIFEDLGISGRVAFYGGNAMGMNYCLLKELIKNNRRIKIAYEATRGLLNMMRETKDEEEIKRIKKAGRNVEQVFDRLFKTVRGMKVRGNNIIKKDGKKLRLGDLKAVIRNELYARGLVCSAGLIVAQGRDAGVPHNAGRDSEVVRLGETIVFDIYPQELGGGYFFDFTRTICFGYAPRRICELYNIVRDAQDFVMEKLTVGKRTIEVERALCRFFERLGHKTFLSDPKTKIGYCHTLGHGLGLNVHESPSFGLTKTNMSVIKPGMVFTVEPGIYYPDQGFGIRLEDVVYIDKKGRIINLTRYRRKIVVEL